MELMLRANLELNEEMTEAAEEVVGVEAEVEAGEQYGYSKLHLVLLLMEKFQSVYHLGLDRLVLK